ncbi:MAG: polyphosphate kinase 1 [Pseudomonadales bacterium]|jgi:polyphosphate kinase|nr:polyphosphate kinase 1 [Pseudomonadales bacterium]
MDAINLASPELYINRELALLEFNRRVLDQSKDEAVPLLERLRFLCIAASNLDEFFEIRVAGLKQQVAYGATQRGPDNLGPMEQLKRISEIGHALVDEQYRVLNEVLIPRLDAENIRFLRRSHWTRRQATWVKRYFTRELVPVLSPIALDPAHPFPRVLNKSLNFIVTLEGKDAFGRNSGMAIVGAPRSLPRLVRLPESATTGPDDFVFLSSVIHQHVSDLFPGMRATGCYQFRVTRNSDLFVDEEEIDDLKRALEGELSARRFGDEVRLELADDCPEEVEAFLVRQFELEETDVYRCNGPVNLTRMMAIPDLVDRPDLKYPGFIPRIPARIRRNDDLFEVIRRGDLLLHHPFESFAPVVDFLRQAARDPHVLAIRQTLYRTGADSAVVKALADAAREGKEVTVVIELRARFDEEANIELANTLQAAGAHVVYGVVGHKTHAKMVLVVRREGRTLRRYVHLGTGNYHARTARLYTDYGLFTCDAAIGEDIQKMFQQLTAMGRVAKLKKVVQSPFALHRHMLDLIAAEVAHARAGRPARIIAKMNALVEPQSIQALYAASQAGVTIDLIVRGVCSLRPGVPGVSETIQVRSIIGRFLEHTRIFYFENGDDEELLYLSSADWMERNFFRRVETCFPIEDRRIRQRIIDESLLNYLADNSQAWLLQSDGSYKRATPGNARRRSAQALLLGELAETSG